MGANCRAQLLKQGKPNSLPPPFTSWESSLGSLERNQENARSLEVLPSDVQMPAVDLT